MDDALNAEISMNEIQKLNKEAKILRDKPKEMEFGMMANLAFNRRASEGVSAVMGLKD